MPLLSHTHIVENEEGDDCQNVRKAHPRHRGELQHWHDSKDVIYEDESEKREQVGNKSHELMADDIFSQIISDEAIDTFACELQFRGNDCRFT